MFGCLSGIGNHVQSESRYLYFGGQALTSRPSSAVCHLEQGYVYADLQVVSLPYKKP